MKTDLYTKVVLTIIALCLVWISFGGPSVLTSVSAQQGRASGYDRVIIAGWLDNTGKEHQLMPQSTTGLPVFVLNP